MTAPEKNIDTAARPSVSLDHDLGKEKGTSRAGSRGSDRSDMARNSECFDGFQLRLQLLRALYGYIAELWCRTSFSMGLGVLRL